MKKVITSVVGLIFLSIATQAQQANAEIYAVKIANRMKDSLSLSGVQKTQLFTINIQIAAQKSIVWQQYAESDSLIAIHLQQIEDTRDSLYKPILGDEKYLLYKTKKKTLISNN